MMAARAMEQQKQVHCPHSQAEPLLDWVWIVMRSMMRILEPRMLKLIVVGPRAATRGAGLSQNLTWEMEVEVEVVGAARRACLPIPPAPSQREPEVMRPGHQVVVVAELAPRAAA